LGCVLDRDRVFDDLTILLLLVVVFVFATLGTRNSLTPPSLTGASLRRLYVSLAPCRVTLNIRRRGSFLLDAPTPEALQ
jgi:hypothetical protein|tara:strand:- start:3319 stop:3555 length:237 start_codon:yes stop_codon:yes gene_type:complete